MRIVKENLITRNRLCSSKTLKFFFLLPTFAFVTIMGSFTSITPVYAGSGINRQINFQGKLVDNNGLNLPDSTYTVVFSLYNVSSGGPAAWTETDNVTTSAGIFQVALGAGTSLPDNVDFNSDTWYLGIKVGADAEMTPRIRFTAVPYAFNASSLDGIVATNSATQFTLTGSTNSLLSLIVNGNITVGSTITPTTAGALTVKSNGTNGLTLDTGGSAALNIGNTNATSLVFGNGNNPTYAFNGTGSVTINGTMLNFGNGAASTIQTSANAGLTLLSAGTGNIILGQNAGNGNVVIQPNAGGQAGLIINKIGVNDLFTASASGATRFIINNSGAVGIGNINNLTGLSATLDVRGNTINGGTIPVASISGKTSFAALIVNNSGNGDLLAASSSGFTRFRLENNGSVLFTGDTISASGSGATNNGSPVVENALGDEGSLVPNAGFEANNFAGPFVDGWVTSSTTSATYTRDSTTMAKGQSSAAVIVSSGQPGILYSSCMPLAIGSSGAAIGNYTLNWYARLAASAKQATVRAYFNGYTSKINCQQNTSPTSSAAQGATLTANTNWQKQGSGTTAVAAFGTNITWARVNFFIASAQAVTQVNIDGVRVIESDTGQGLDYAENYPADPNNIAQAGDVVTLEATKTSSQVAPARQSMDQSVIGVVSSHPGQVLDDGTISDPKVPVALAGRVPVNVSTANGPIHIGDYLASSVIPGVAVKATNAGSVIGTAMEESNVDPRTISQITMFIKNTYYAGVPMESGISLASGQDSSVILAMLEGQNDMSPTINTDTLRAGLRLLSRTTGSIATSSASVLGSFTQDITQQNAASSATSKVISLQNVSIDRLATVSGDLRVKGDSFVEGALHMFDSFVAKSLVVSGIADFLNGVVFHSDVTFDGRPTFNSDSAGFAIIAKDADHVDVTFEKEYSQMPIVTATMSLDTISPTPNESSEIYQNRQQAYQKSILQSQLFFVISNRSTKGFTILLSKPINEDITFSWNAVAISHTKTFKSSQIGASPLDVSPTISLPSSISASQSADGK